MKKRLVKTLLAGFIMSVTLYNMTMAIQLSGKSQIFSTSSIEALSGGYSNGETKPENWVNGYKQAEKKVLVHYLVFVSPSTGIVQDLSTYETINCCTSHNNNTMCDFSKNHPKC